MGVRVNRVLFLGLDGGTMSVLRPGFERGWIPNLACLWERSAHGTLRSTQPMVTPVAWTSFATGCPPLDHGIHDFSYLDPSDRTVRANHAGRVRVPTLWRILSQAGCDVVSLNLPLTYPPPGVRGLIVSGADAPTLERAFTQCPRFGEEVRAEVPDFTHKLLWKRRPETLDALQAEAARNRAIYRAQVEVALRADARADWTALMVHFHNLDGFQHRLWPYLDIDETGLREAGWNTEVERCLKTLDDCVGRLLDLAAQRDAAVITVSDHGFGPCRALVNVNGLLRAANLQRGQIYGTRFRYRAIRLAERFRRWRARRRPGGVAPPTARPIEGQIACDWNRTVAFAPFGQLSGSIFLNPATVKGEFAEAQATAEVIGLLREASDPITGAPLFRDVFAVAERYGVDPAREGLPDVLALSADGFQAQAKWPSRLGNALVRPDWNLPATHWINGVIAIDAPGVQPGERLRGELHDVAPTALALLGFDIPDNMKGRVLHEAFHDPLPVHYGPVPEIGEEPHDPALLAAGLGAEWT